jgi:hypothetical protein
MVGAGFPVPSIDEKSIAADRFSSNDVTGAIPHHKASFQIDFPAFRCLDQHPRLRLAARAAGILRMRTHEDIVDGHPLAQSLVHCRNHSFIDQAVADVRLIRDDDHQQSMGFEFTDRGGHARQQAKVGKTARRESLTVPNAAAVYDTIAVQENGSSQIGGSRIYSKAASITGSPLRCVLLQHRMRHKAVPDDRVKCLRMRRDQSRIHRWNDDDMIAHFFRITAVATDDAEDL